MEAEPLHDIISKLKTRKRKTNCASREKINTNNVAMIHESLISKISSKRKKRLGNRYIPKSFITIQKSRPKLIT